MVPGDLANIYNFNPAYQWRTIRARARRSRRWSKIRTCTALPLDFDTFRATFGLASAYSSGCVRLIHGVLSTAGDCTDPAWTADDAEAVLDAEWASAAGARCGYRTRVLRRYAHQLRRIHRARESAVGFSDNPPAIVSISYGESETELGAAGNAYINSLYQTAAARWGCRCSFPRAMRARPAPMRGIKSCQVRDYVSGFASTPYNTATVGGTDSAITSPYGTSGTYWNSSNGSSYFESAKSYIPEMPWNEPAREPAGLGVVGSAIVNLRLGESAILRQHRGEPERTLLFRGGCERRTEQLCTWRGCANR